MKCYKANDELIEILKKQNFIETSDKRDIIKGKKRFKLSKSSRKQVEFDYVTIRFLNGCHGQDEKLNLSEEELKLLLFYFKLKSNDIDEVFFEGNFKFKNACKKLNDIKTELKKLIEFDLYKLRRKKLIRILETYNSIEF